MVKAKSVKNARGVLIGIGSRDRGRFSFIMVTTAPGFPLGGEYTMSDDTRTTLRASMDMPLEPAQAFDTLIEELAGSLSRLGMDFSPGADGRLTAGGFE